MFQWSCYMHPPVCLGTDVGTVGSRFKSLPAAYISCVRFTRAQFTLSYLDLSSWLGRESVGNLQQWKEGVQMTLAIFSFCILREYFAPRSVVRCICYF